MRLTLDQKKVRELRRAFLSKTRPKRIRERKRVSWKDRLENFLFGYKEGSTWNQAIVLRFPKSEGYFKEPKGKERSLIEKLFGKKVELRPSKAIGTTGFPLVAEWNEEKEKYDLVKGGPIEKTPYLSLGVDTLFPTNRKTATAVLKEAGKVIVRDYPLPPSKKTQFSLSQRGVIERGPEGGTLYGIVGESLVGRTGQMRLVTRRDIELPNPRNPVKGILRPEEVDYETAVPAKSVLIDIYPADEFSPREIKKELKGKGVIFL